MALSLIPNVQLRFWKSKDFKDFAAFKFSEFFKEFPDANRADEEFLNAQESFNPQEKPKTLEALSELWDQIFEYVRHLRKERQDFDTEMTKLKDEHLRSMEEAKTRLGREHTKEIKQKDREIKRLVGQLLVNQDDNQAWPDDELKKKFKELQLLINSLTSHRKNEFMISQNCQLESYLDPTNFVGRVSSKHYFLLRSSIWNIICEQFFSAPFGFGAIGPGKGQEKLTAVYSTWRQLLDLPGREGVSEKDSFSAFHCDQLANSWRSATFQSVSAELTRSDEHPSALGSLIAKLSADNVNHTISRILGFLSDISKLSNSKVTPEVEEQIRNIAKLALEIALQFGIHPAQLRLTVPNRGEEVRIGEEYHHCENAALNAGSVCVVDLVTLPGLLKTGDGRSDLTSKRAIVPCEIYPERPSA